MHKEATYFAWSANRIMRFLIKAMLFPLMAATCIPALVFDGLLRICNWLDGWWWA